VALSRPTFRWCPGEGTGAEAAAGGHIQPGISAGTLTVTGNLTLSDGALLDYELGAMSASDTISMSGSTSTLYLNGQDFSDFHFTAFDGFGVGTYTLIDARTISGSLSTSNLSGMIGSGFRGTLSVAGNDLVLTTVAVPEPGTLALLVAAGAAFVGWRRRK
jgi:hypothetical protein